MSEKTYNAEYYQKNRDRILAYQREYHHRTKNAERTLRVREYNRQYYLKNKPNWNRRVANRPFSERPKPSVLNLVSQKEDTNTRSDSILDVPTPCFTIHFK